MQLDAVTVESEIAALSSPANSWKKASLSSGSPTLLARSVGLLNVICKPNRFLDGLRSLGFLALNNRRASKFLRHRFEGTGPA